MDEPVVEDIKLEDIDWESSTQVRVQIDEETVNRYAELLDAGANFPPVAVFRGEGGSYLLADGFHRVQAYKKQDRDVIRRHVSTSAHLPERTVGADGKSYRASRARKSSLAARKPQPEATQTPASSSSTSQHAAPAAAAPESGPVPSAENGTLLPSGAENGTLLPPAPEPPAPAVAVEGKENGTLLPTVSSEPSDTRSSRQIARDTERIVSAVADRAEHLMDQSDQMVLTTLDPAKLEPWLEQLRTGRRALDDLIARIEAL